MSGSFGSEVVSKMRLQRRESVNSKSSTKYENQSRHRESLIIKVDFNLWKGKVRFNY